MLAAGATLALAALWLLVTGLLARSQLSSIHAELDELRVQIAHGDIAGADHTASLIGTHAHRAHELTKGPAWSIASSLPAGGSPFETVRVITDQIDELGQRVLPGVVSAGNQLDPATLRRPDGVIDVARIARAAPTISQAHGALAAAITRVGTQPSHSWLSPVDSARTGLLDQLTYLEHTLHSAELATRIVPTMLGQHGVQRYFVAFQNEAEARGTGGIPGSFAIMSVNDGRIHFDRFEPDSTLESVATGLNLGADYAKLFAGGRSTSFYPNTDLSPHFPYAARIWIAMWQKYSHQKLDGAVSLDPTALSYLLGATGHATMPDGTYVSSKDVVALTESTVYAKFPKISQKPQRKHYLLEIAQTVSKAVINSDAGATKLFKAAGAAAARRRLLVYSADPAIEAELNKTSLSGALPVTTAPFVGPVVVNVAGGKLDYYLSRTITWHRSGCGATRQVTVTFRLTNHAPASGLSPYVTYRADFPNYPTKPGDDRLAVYYYATDGATLRSLTIDGRASPSSSGTLRRHPVFVADVELPQGTTRVVTFTLTEPAATGAPVVLRQPLVRPLHLHLQDDACR